MPAAPAELDVLHLVDDPLLHLVHHRTNPRPLSNSTHQLLDKAISTRSAQIRVNIAGRVHRKHDPAFGKSKPVYKPAPDTAAKAASLKAAKRAARTHRKLVAEEEERERKAQERLAEEQNTRWYMPPGVTYTPALPLSKGRSQMFFLEQKKLEQKKRQKEEEEREEKQKWKRTYRALRAKSEARLQQKQRIGLKKQ
jgi:hypothetical protein